jgi:transposase
VILETSSESFAIAEAAAACGHQVRVIPATLVRTLGVGRRGIKTDRRDAQLLSEVSCRIDLPTVHISSKASRERKAMCAMRESLVESRTKLINTVRGWLRTELLRVATGATYTFPRRVCKVWQEKRAQPLPAFVERTLKAIDSLSEEIDQADREIERLAKTDPVCARLMTVVGVGPVTAIRFTSTVDDLARFSSAHALESYLGVTPGEDSSADRQRRTAITKAGSPKTRWALVQAAWVARRYKADPMVQWSYEVEKRRGRRVAIVALARKIAGILFAIWRDGTTYDPAKTAQVPST